MIAIKPLSDTSIELIHQAFKNAFSDYVEPFTLTKRQLQYMIERRKCNLNLSFGAFDGSNLVGFTLNGIGDWNGKLTAYDTGTGVIKEYRKRGIATQIFDESLPILKANNIKQYLLEVIVSNTSAHDLYKKAGFTVVRNFNYYISEKNQTQIKNEKEDIKWNIEEIKHPDWNLLKSFWDFEPSWQNSIKSINGKFNYFKVLGIYKAEILMGYGIIEKTTGDIPQLAIAHNCRRNGLASVLFKHLMNCSETDLVKIINTDASYEPFNKFAESINFSLGIGQFEMIRYI